MEFSSLTTLVEQGEGFVIFRSPNQSEVFLISGQWAAANQEIPEDSFVFSSFLGTSRFALSAQKKQTIVGYSKLLTSALHQKMHLGPLPDKSVSLEKYQQIITETIAELKQGKADKAVISRSIPLTGNYHHGNSFESLLNENPSAFCYYLYIPGIGCWMGASPERLIEGNEESGYSTYSLAGTKNKDAEWTEKELDEQQMVTDFVVQNLSEFTIEKPIISSTQTVDVGKFHHLRSTIQFTCKQYSLPKLIEQLHPTPAVCGTPKESALSIINKLENYNREFYSGYLGLYSKQDTALFVNLRCAQLHQNGISVYVGGGITKLSDPETEWKETELKSRVVKSVVHKIS